VYEVGPPYLVNISFEAYLTGASRVAILETRGSCLHLLVAVSKQPLNLSKNALHRIAIIIILLVGLGAQIRSMCGVTSYSEIISSVLRPFINLCAQVI